MPDPASYDCKFAPTIERDIPSIPPDRPAVNEMAGPHSFIPSEFAPESGRCDICGGGSLAEIHQKPVDQMARIADALERFPEKWAENVDVLDGGSAQARLDMCRIADALDSIDARLEMMHDGVGWLLKRIGKALERIAADKARCQ